MKKNCNEIKEIPEYIELNKKLGCECCSNYDHCKKSKFFKEQSELKCPNMRDIFSIKQNILGILINIAVQIVSWIFIKKIWIVLVISLIVPVLMEIPNVWISKDSLYRRLILGYYKNKEQRRANRHEKFVKKLKKHNNSIEKDRELCDEMVEDIVVIKSRKRNSDKSETSNNNKYTKEYYDLDDIVDYIEIIKGSSSGIVPVLFLFVKGLTLYSTEYEGKLLLAAFISVGCGIGEIFLVGSTILSMKYILDKYIEYKEANPEPEEEKW